MNKFIVFDIGKILKWIIIYLIFNVFVSNIDKFIKLLRGI